MSDDEKRLPVWPFTDEYFEGDAVDVMLSRFGDALGEHVGLNGCGIKRIADVLAGLDEAVSEGQADAATQLLRMDAISAAQRTLRVLSEEWRDREDVAGASFHLGAAFALMHLAEEGVFESAERKAWLQGRQSGGGSNKPPRTWWLHADRMARDIWAAAPAMSKAGIAAKVHKRMDAPAWRAEHPEVTDLPSDSQRIARRLASLGGRPGLMRRHVDDDGREVDGDRD
jgi:hypothetical protein